MSTTGVSSKTFSIGALVESTPGPSNNVTFLPMLLVLYEFNGNRYEEDKSVEMTRIKGPKAADVTAEIG